MDTLDTSDNVPRPERVERVEMVAEHLCPFCGERATLHCASCGRVVCAEHVARGFSLGYAFICLDCVAMMAEAAEDDGAGD